MAIAYDYITAILEQFEGKGLTQGYVPKDKNGNARGNSGVTIGTGVDLGQQTNLGLIAMGVPVEIVEQLSPYIGLRKQAAIDKLRSHPLVLSQAEVTALDAAVIPSYVNEVASRFDLQSKKPGAFAELHENIQAVLVSLRYQLGFGGFPATWNLILHGNYFAAVRELDDPGRWGGKYTTRRQAEAELLREAIGI